MFSSVLLCVAGLSLAAGQQPAPAADEILKREQQRIEYLTTGKLDEAAAMMSPAMTYTHSSGAMDAKDKLMADLRSKQVVYTALKHADVQVRFPTPDVAIMTGISDVSVTVGGKPLEVPLRFTIVYVKKNGQWLMELWHSTRRPA